MSRFAKTVYHPIEGYITGSTDAAILIDIHKIAGEELHDGHEHKKAYWFPVSQCSKIIRQPKGSIELDSVMVAEWLLKKKEMI